MDSSKNNKNVISRSNAPRNLTLFTRRFLTSFGMTKKIGFVETLSFYSVLRVESTYTLIFVFTDLLLFRNCSEYDKMPSKRSNAKRKIMRNRFIIILFFAFLFTHRAVIPSTIKEVVALINQPLSRGVFLVATHDLGGSYFSNSVILLAKYNHEGALGVIINRPLGISLPEALPDFKGLKKDLGSLFIGGPIARFSPFLLLRTEREAKNAHHIFDNTFYSTDIKSTIEFIINKTPKGRVRVYAGYAGWYAGQLESEVARGSWKVIRADQYTIFDKDPDTIWDDLIKGDTPLFIKKPGKGFMAG